MFLPGDSVVCIDDFFDEHAMKALRYFPVKGEIYTIREIKIDYDYPNDGPSVLLEEIVNPMISTRNIKGIYKTLEPRFKRRRFEKLIPNQIVEKIEEDFAHFTIQTT